MLRILSVLFTFIIVDLYYFPTTLMAFPTVNSKMVLAVVGLILFLIQSAKRKFIPIDYRFTSAVLLALLFSLFCLFTVTFNNTSDYAYATYFVSMAVWLFGAYAVIYFIRNVHGLVSLELLAHYIILVCVVQCLLALLIDNYMPAKILVDRIFFQQQDFLNDVNRLYGIGAMLDTAGIRFSIALILISYLISVAQRTTLAPYMPIYIVSFLIISIVGNMMARTTSVGLVLSLLYLLYKQFNSPNEKPFSGQVVRYILVFSAVATAILVYFYNTNLDVHNNIRFAFEGFFSLFEKGEWDVGSNNQLANMVVFPDNMKTWLIGDGYFNNPTYTDPYFTGEFIGGYYMGTDVGYLRFIFYCGVIGLFFFSSFLIKTANYCAEKFPSKRAVFVFLVFLSFAVWLKVSSDIFLIFALFLFVDEEEDELYNERIREIA